MLLLLLAVGGLFGCASFNDPDDSPFEVEITDLPGGCDGLQFKLSVCQGARSYTFLTTPAEGGTVTWSGYKSEAGQCIELDPEGKITVKAKLMKLSPGCEALLEAALPGNPDLSSGSMGSTVPLCPTECGEWKAKVSDITF